MKSPKREDARVAEKEPAKQEARVADPPAEPSPRKKGTVSRMDLGTLFGLQGENRALLVDVRPPFWYTAGHIPGAINFPLKRYDADLPARKAQLEAALASGKVVVLYCANVDCLDARTVAEKLAKEGLSTSVYKGGWREWKASGLGE